MYIPTSQVHWLQGKPKVGTGACYILTLHVDYIGKD